MTTLVTLEEIWCYQQKTMTPPKTDEETAEKGIEQAINSKKTVEKFYISNASLGAERLWAGAEGGPHFVFRLGFLTDCYVFG